MERSSLPEVLYGYRRNSDVAARNYFHFDHHSFTFSFHEGKIKYQVGIHKTC
jgi:hypothetical protein